MALYTVPLPSVDGGDEDISRQMRKIIGYLRQLDEQLKYVLCNLDGENLSDSFRAVIDSSTDAESADGWTEIDAPGEDAPEVIAAVDEAISILKGEEQG